MSLLLLLAAVFALLVPLLILPTFLILILLLVTLSLLFLFFLLFLFLLVFLFYPLDLFLEFTLLASLDRLLIDNGCTEPRILKVSGTNVKPVLKYGENELATG